jgi:hypothetical protein
MIPEAVFENKESLLLFSPFSNSQEFFFVTWYLRHLTKIKIIYNKYTYLTEEFNGIVRRSSQLADNK